MTTWKEAYEKYKREKHEAYDKKEREFDSSHLKMAYYDGWVDCMYAMTDKKEPQQVKDKE